MALGREDMQTTTMPEWIDKRHAELNESARRCYKLRDDTSDTERATALHNLGDLFFLDALSISAEWDEPLPDNTHNV